MTAEPSLSDKAQVEGKLEFAAVKPLNIVTDLERVPIGDTGFTRDDAMTIRDQAGKEWMSHQDGGSTSHWFGIVKAAPDASDPYELRYFRALMGEGSEFRHDSYPVMPLPDDKPASAWALPGLAMYLEKGDIYMAQQFAHDVADSYGQAFPNPHDLPALDPHPDYYFGYGIGPQERPALEAVKTWMDGSERRFDTFIVTEYAAWDDARGDVAALEDLLAQQGVEAAMNRAERMAAAGGYLDPQRADPRVFFADDGPPDPFTTVRERELAVPQYSVGAVSANGEHFLDVMKTWGEGDYQRLVIPQLTWEDAHLQAEMVFTLQVGGDLQGAMQLVEQAGVDAGVIDPVRSDPRLFTQGPLDPFQTLRELEIDDHLARYGVTWREAHEWQADADHLREGSDNPPRWQMETLQEMPGVRVTEADAPEPGSWDELIAQQTPDESEPERHCWQMHYRPVETSDGEPLGVALFVTEFPQLPPDFDEYSNKYGMDDSVYPIEARTLEMAHFANEDNARKFEAEFRSYLVPGLLDGPELAPEVAKLEGLSGEWEDMDYRGIVDYTGGDRTVVREADEWHLHNPNAEREAREQSDHGISHDLDL